MKRAATLALALTLLAGCARETALQAAKTAGNIVPWTLLAAGVILVVPVTIAALCDDQP